METAAALGRLPPIRKLPLIPLDYRSAIAYIDYMNATQTTNGGEEMTEAQAIEAVRQVTRLQEDCRRAQEARRARAETLMKLMEALS